MPRKKTEKVTDPFERARLKKLRAAERRAARKRRAEEGGDDSPRQSRRKDTPDYSTPMVRDDYQWIRSGRARSHAKSILDKERKRPYWLSFKYKGTKKDGPLPLSHFFPCTIFRSGDRAYYGFLFREHRDMFFASLGKGRKELTHKMRKLAPHLT